MASGGLTEIKTHDRAESHYIRKEIGKLLSEIWLIKGLSEQEYGSGHPITKKLISMHGEAQALLQEKPEE